MKLSVIVPCFNEQEVIAATHERLTTVLGAITQDYEIVYVDDGSRDKTAELLKAICDRDQHARAIRLARNFGHQNALAAGLASVTGDAAVIIDADLQDPPEVIPEFVAKWREGYEVVVGQRLERPNESLFKRATASIFYRLLNRLSDVPVHLDAGDFRLVDRKVIDTLNAMPERYRLLRGMMSWIGFRQAVVPYKRAPRFAGKTKYSLSKMFSLAFDGLFSFSTMPLRMMTLVGITLFLLAMLGVAYALVLRLTTNVWVEGWTALFIAEMLLGGFNLLGLGLLGEYVGRIYGEAKQRPLFVVMETYPPRQPVGSAPVRSAPSQPTTGLGA